MPNRNLTVDELELANQLLDEIRGRLACLAKNDPNLLFAYRRKIAKELPYDERGKPGSRGKLKAMKWGLQQGKCAHCGKDLPVKFSELDRRNAADGYTAENTELIHGECHRQRQAARGWA